MYRKITVAILAATAGLLPAASSATAPAPLMTAAQAATAPVSAPKAAPATVSRAEFRTYVRKVYRRPEVSKAALRKLDRMRHHAASKKSARAMLRQQHAASRDRYRRLDPWGYRRGLIPPGTEAFLDRLAYCESTGNPTASNGLHTGYFQYDDRTWAEAGGSGRAMYASPDEQYARTAKFFPGHESRWDASRHCWG